MDNKRSHRFKLEEYWRRHRDGRPHKHPLAMLFGAHKESLCTALLLLMLLMLLFGVCSQLQAPVTDGSPGDATEVNYSTFLAQVETKNLLRVYIQGDKLIGVLAHPFERPDVIATPDGAYNPFALATSSVEPPTVYTRLPARADASLLPLLLSKGIVIITSPIASPPIWVLFLEKYASLLLAFFALLLVVKPPPWKGFFSSDASLDDKITQIAERRIHRMARVRERSEADTASDEAAQGEKRVVPVVTFSDVAGVDEVRAELEEIVQFLRNPQHFHGLGAHVPRGILLVGPPGTGKTLLARAVAGEAGVPFFVVSASEFVEMFVGVGASRVRQLFQRARQSAPCVVFIDELDAVGKRRSTMLLGHGERDQTLNQLLVELDGFDNRSTVIVLAATNRVDMLDRALLRPGRFDRRIVVSLPDRRGREAILRVHTRCTPLDDDVRLDALASMTAGMSGAELANLVNEAALHAARCSLNALTYACFEVALTRIQLGVRRPLVMSEQERCSIAIRESGHALVAYYLPEADIVNWISIRPHGRRIGVTQFIAEKERYRCSREVLMARVAVALAGRVAEELTFGLEHITAGAEDDLQAATALARNMVMHWGMGKQTGVVFADDAKATAIDREVRDVLDEGRATAHTVLSEHANQLATLAAILIERECLNRRQFEEVLHGSAVSHGD